MIVKPDDGKNTVSAQSQQSCRRDEAEALLFLRFMPQTCGNLKAGLKAGLRAKLREGLKAGVREKIKPLISARVHLSGHIGWLGYRERVTLTLGALTRLP